MVTNMKTYEELISLKDYDSRLKYLQTGSIVGKETFGEDRYINQMLYGSNEWKRTRRKVIIRDMGNDLAIEGLRINDNEKVIVHHINPITEDDILSHDNKVLDMNNLITVSESTHKKIHYGSKELNDYIPRRPNDTIPWR